MVINKFIKSAYNNGEEPNLTFWRDSVGNEVDLLQNMNGKQYAYEIKSGATFSPEFFKGVSKWAKLSGAAPQECFVVYSGNKEIISSAGKLTTWWNLNK